MDCTALDLKFFIMIFKKNNSGTFAVDLSNSYWYYKSVKLKQTAKKDILNRIVDIPKTQKRHFWSREIKILNDLFKIYPVEEFWSVIRFNKKYESMTFLLSDYGKKLLKKRFLEFTYVVPETQTIELGEKTGEDFNVENKPKTIKDFLKTWVKQQTKLISSYQIKIT